MKTFFFFYGGHLILDRKTLWISVKTFFWTEKHSELRRRPFFLFLFWRSPGFHWTIALIQFKTNENSGQVRLRLNETSKKAPLCEILVTRLIELPLQYFAFFAPLPVYGYAIVNCILSQKIKEPPHVYHYLMITCELNLFHLTFVGFSCCALDFLYLIKYNLIKKILEFEQIGKIKGLITDWRRHVCKRYWRLHN